MLICARELSCISFGEANGSFSRVLDKDVISPCVIEVLSSVDFQIHPDEDDGNLYNEAPELFGPQSTETESLFIETYTLKGSSFHEHFQRTLKNCKQKIINKESVPVKLGFEPVNRRDENAIQVHARTENSWEPIGYIPGVKVAKVTEAIRNKEITTMAIHSVKYQYVFAISSFKYFAVMTKNKDSYKYNEDI